MPTWMFSILERRSTGRLSSASRTTFSNSRLVIPFKLSMRSTMMHARRHRRMREFKGVDFYAADRLFSEEELMVRDTVRSFVTEKLLPVLPDCWEKGTFPKQLIP